MDHLLTFELLKDLKQIEIHGDAEGLRLLARILDRLADQSEAGGQDHDHLKSSEWAGWELTTDLQSKDDSTQAIHHVKVLAWPNAKGQENA